MNGSKRSASSTFSSAGSNAAAAASGMANKRSRKEEIVEDLIDGDELEQDDVEDENATVAAARNNRRLQQQQQHQQLNYQPNENAMTSNGSGTSSSDHHRQQQPDKKLCEFGNILDAVKLNYKQSGDDIELSRNLAQLNDQLEEIVTTNANEKVLSMLTDELDQQLPLQLRSENNFCLWLTLSALKMPTNLSSNPNASLIEDCFKTLMAKYEKLEGKLRADEMLTEDEEVELHILASKYFKSLLSLVSSMKTKHLRSIVNSRNFVYFETCSSNIQHMIKQTFNFRICEGYDPNEVGNRHNPMFKIDGCGMVACKTKEVRQKNITMTVYDLHEDCQSYLGRLFYETFVQRIPRFKTVLANSVFFNTVTQQNVASIVGLDKKALVDPNLLLAHVSLNDAFFQPSKTKGQMLLIVTLYVNYFVRAA